MNNVLLWIGGILIAALALLFAVPYAIDWNGYRGLFEEEASRVLGREVRVGGNVSLRLLPSPYVQFDKLRIAGAEAGEPLFRADNFTMWLAVPPLLRGVIEAQEVTLRRPVVRLSLDEEGRGNWGSLSINPGGLPFVPSGVTLSSVKISKGSIVVAGRDGREIHRIDGFNGELSGDAIEGPYRFAGTLEWKGEHRELKFATAPPDKDGSIRFKTTVRVTANGNTYVFDGRVADILGLPRYTGELKAQLSLAAYRALARAGADAAQGPASSADGQAAFELAGAVEGDGKAASFKDIALSFDTVTPPQLITGEAKADWSDSLSLDLTLSSRWLDLDKVLSAGAEGVPPLKAAAGLLDAATGLLPEGARTSAQLSVEQLNLGGDAISGLAVALTRSDGPLKIEHAAAHLPGGTTLSAEGVLVQGGEPGFDGRVRLRGTSLPRLLAWLGTVPAGDVAAGEGPFALHGDLAVAPLSVALTNAGLEFGATAANGELRYTSDPGRLAVVIDGETIDSREVRRLANLLFDAAAGAPSPDSTLMQRLPSSVRLQLNAGAIAIEGETLRDVRADVSIEAGRLLLPALAFKSDNGLALEAEGSIDKITERPAGSVRFVLGVQSAAALRSLTTLGVPAEPWRTVAGRAEALVPLRIAGTFDIGRSGRGVSIAFDGATKIGRIAASADLGGGLASWREAPIALSAHVEGSGIEDLIQRLGDIAPTHAEVADTRAGSLLFAAKGESANALALAAKIDTEGLLVSYEGRLSGGGGEGEGPFGIEGTLDIHSRDLSDTLRLAGMPLPVADSEIPTEGKVDLVRRGNTTIVKPRDLLIGGHALTGQLTLTTREGAPLLVAGNLKVSDAAVSALLAPFLGEGSDEPAVAEKGREPVWPAQPFDFARLEGVEGRLGITAGHLVVTPGLSLERAHVEAALTPGKLAVTRLDGHALGGTLVSAFDIEKAPAGVTLKGKLEMTGVSLVAVSKDQPAARPVAGSADAALAFSSQALSPRALLASLTGKGEIVLNGVKVGGLSPGSVLDTADSVLLDRTPGKGEGLAKALKAALAQGELDFGSRTVPLDIVDGAARIKAFSADGAKGRTTAEITLDLASLSLDSEWRIEPKAPEGSRRPSLPPVSVVYVGALADVAALEPRISADALERELTVRRMERDVDELERLRKADEARAKEEAERQKAVEAERLRALEQSPPKPAAADAAGGTSHEAVRGAPEGWNGNQAAGASVGDPAESRTNTGSSGSQRPPRKKPQAGFDPWSQLN